MDFVGAESAASAKIPAASATDERAASTGAPRKTALAHRVREHASPKNLHEHSAGKSEKRCAEYTAAASAPPCHRIAYAHHDAAFGKREKPPGPKPISSFPAISEAAASANPRTARRNAGMEQ